MESPIRATIDGGGRVVIPKRVRERLGLTAGAPVTISSHDGLVEIRPAYLDVELVRKGSVTVIEGGGRVPPIDADDVRLAMERIRQE